jgi:hypothetical protein
MWTHGPGQDRPAPVLTVFAGMDHMLPADKVYMDTYGGSSFLPSVRAEIKVDRKNFAWAQFSFLKETGATIGEFNEAIEVSQYFFSAGGGYRVRLSQSSSLDLRYGGVYFMFNETSFQEENSGNTIGLELAVDYKMRFASRMFFVLSASYLLGKSESEDYKLSIKPGGFKTGLGLGIGF